MRASVIIPTKDRLEILAETLKTVAAAIEGIDGEIIVVNDSSRTKPDVHSYPKVVVIDNPGRGVASARNAGAAKAKSACLIFMDDDFLIESTHLKTAIEYALKEPDRIYLFDWTYPPDMVKSLPNNHFGRYLIQHGYTSLRGWLAGEWQEEDVFELTGGASYFFAMQKRTFELVGGYDERFPHAGAEDYDFVSRLRKQGIRYYLDRRFVIYHNERDRLDPISFFARKKRNGETIAIAGELGYSELKVNYPFAKRVLLEVLSGFKPLLGWIHSAIPDLSVFDALYFRLTNTLLAIHFFEGYSAKRQ
ncbi:MAG: glycosyltransferase family 2 protein [Cyclobacteriaceae bacterium]|nr:glycosyltransferase family 2 protein [Cyclobacteriaceae bacterium]